MELEVLRRWEIGVEYFMLAILALFMSIRSLKNSFDWI